MRLGSSILAVALLVLFDGGAQAECPEKLGNDPGRAVLRECVEEIAKLRNELRAVVENQVQSRLVSSIAILAVAAVRKQELIPERSSEGVEFDKNTGLLSFRNPEALPFVPIVADFVDRNVTYITDTHFIQGTSGTDKIFVRAKALDTGGADRTVPPHDFTAVVLGIRADKKSGK